MKSDGCNAHLYGGKSKETSPMKSQAPNIDENRGDANVVAVETPDKNSGPSWSRMNVNASVAEGGTPSFDDSLIKSGSVVEVSERYNMIAIFFDKLECSVRLLKLQRKPSIFSYISNQVEILTKRKFLHRHLAQIKYIFPEAIHVEKILTLNKKTSCMVPDMKIGISFIAVENSQNISTSKALRQDFRARLAKFVHEDIDIPEAALPEPFNCRSQIGNQKQLSIEPSREFVSPGCDFVAGVLPLSLESKRSLDSEVQDSPFKSSVTSVHSCDLGKNTSCDSQGFHICGTTPSKSKITSAKLMLATPELQTPKALKIYSPDEKIDGKPEIAIQSARKSLTFSPSKTNLTSPHPAACLNGPGGSNQNSDDQMVVKRIAVEQHSHENSTVKNKCHNGAPEILKYEDRNAKMYQLQAGLPDLFDSIRCIFQSIKSSSITKQELVHKIIFHNFEIEDAEEVEEQLKLLEKLVPDWICQKISSGDLIYCIQKACNPDAIRAKLVEAT